MAKNKGLYIIEDIGGGKRDIWHILRPNRKRKLGIRPPSFVLTKEEINKYNNCSNDTRWNALIKYTEKCKKIILNSIDNDKFQLVKIYDNKISSKCWADVFIAYKKILQ